MKTNQHNLRVAVVSFAQQTCLLIGESSSFSWLADELDETETVVLSCESHESIEYLMFIPSAQGGFMSEERGALKWFISGAERSVVSGQLRELASSETPAHAYLDPAVNNSMTQIIASKGEYDSLDVFSNGDV